MRDLLLILSGFIAGAALMYGREKPNKPRSTIMPKIIISATEKVRILATIQDFDEENEPVGDPRPALVSEFDATLENASAGFGSIVFDEEGPLLDPGSAGESGTVVLTTKDGKSSGRLDIELSVGAVTHSAIEVALGPIAPIETGSDTPPAGTTDGNATTAPVDPNAGGQAGGESSPPVELTVLEKITALGEEAVDKAITDWNADESHADNQIVLEDGDTLEDKAELLADAGFVPAEAAADEAEKTSE